MKPRNIILIVLFFITTNSFSQIYGFKFGWSQPDYNLNSHNLSQYNNHLYQGYQYGAFVRTDSSRFYFQIEAFYQKAEETFLNEPGKPNFTLGVDTFNQHVVIQTINIPFTLGFRLLRFNHFDLRAYGGIQSSVTLSKKLTSLLPSTPINENMVENIVVKYIVGVGFDFYFISCDLRYYFDNVPQIKSTDAISFPYKDKYFNYSVAIKF